MDIRAATVADAGTLAELGAIVQALHHHHHPDVFKPGDAAGTRPLYEQILSDPSVRAFLAEDGGEALGYVLARRVSEPETPLNRGVAVVDVNQIGVRPEARHKGIGRALMDRVKELAVESGADRVRLTVWEFNEPARRFFAAMGLAVDRRRMTAMIAGPGAS